MTLDDITWPPIGRNAKYLVRLNDNPFAGFDTHDEAVSYVEMQKSKKKGGGQPAFAADGVRNTWTIQAR